MGILQIRDGRSNNYISNSSLGLGDMLDKVVENFDQSLFEQDDDEYIRIAVVGKPNVGKSSLINKLLGEERVIVSEIAGTTRDAIDSNLNNELGKFILVDTAGIRRKSKVKAEIEKYSVIRTLTAIERADVSILMIDATEGITDQDEKIIGYAHEMKKAIMIVVNKWDLVEKDDNTMVNSRKNSNKVLSFYLMLNTYLYLQKLDKELIRYLELAKKCYDNYSKRISTGILNEVLDKAVLMKEPPIVGFKRMKILLCNSGSK